MVKDEIKVGLEVIGFLFLPARWGRKCAPNSSLMMVNEALMLGPGLPLLHFHILKIANEGFRNTKAAITPSVDEATEMVWGWGLVIKRNTGRRICG